MYPASPQSSQAEQSTRVEKLAGPASGHPALVLVRFDSTLVYAFPDLSV
jgi:hypothetical protein